MNRKYLISGIYAIVNLVNNKRYIGQALHLLRRKNDHFKGRNSNVPLQRAMQKYGKENFEFIILEYVEPIKEKLDSAEQRYLDFYKDKWDRLYNFRLEVQSSKGCFHDHKYYEEYISINHAAKMIGVKTATIIFWIARNNFMTLEEDGRTYIYIPSFREYIYARNTRNNIKKSEWNKNISRDKFDKNIIYNQN